VRSGGESGIRTHEAFQPAGFQDQCIRPLCHLSKPARMVEGSQRGRTLKTQRMTSAGGIPLRRRGDQDRIGVADRVVGESDYRVEVWLKSGRRVIDGDESSGEVIDPECGRGLWREGG
jgi:hypothetical protein